MGNESFSDLEFWDGATVRATLRLTLRRFKASDLPGYADLNADPEVMKYLGGNPMSRSDSDAMAAGAQRSFSAAGIGKIAVERTADGAFLGMCGLSREHWYPDDLEIGWRFDRRYWGQGYATEAALVWLDYAFTVLGADRVISISDVPNQRSIAVMARIGLTLDHEAELHEGDDTFAAVIYSISRMTWLSRRSGV
jgi:RimJ/RimL family protein N-acetyltransferase